MISNQWYLSMFETLRQYTVPLFKETNSRLCQIMSFLNPILCIESTPGEKQNNDISIKKLFIPWNFAPKKLFKASQAFLGHYWGPLKGGRHYWGGVPTVPSLNFKYGRFALWGADHVPKGI